MMSRSFGDALGQKCGVISLPDIKIFNRKENCFKGLLLASDGLTDQLDLKSIAEICQNWYNKGENASRAAGELVDEAKARCPTVRFSYKEKFSNG